YQKAQIKNCMQRALWFGLFSIRSQRSLDARYTMHEAANLHTVDNSRRDMNCSTKLVRRQVA
ncbi:MAG TPA: hypothetical protein VL949_11390, partial [Geobacteraceae bacterium]|nr:hypothetical protein [Geobacteraceae bacterium]